MYFFPIFIVIHVIPATGAVNISIDTILISYLRGVLLLYKKIIAYILILAIAFSIACLHSYADTPESSVTTLWDKMMLNLIDTCEDVPEALSGIPIIGTYLSVVGTLTGWAAASLSSNLCSLSDDNLHHGHLHDPITPNAEGTAVLCECDYCGDSFWFYSSDYKDAYEDMINTVWDGAPTTINSDGSFVWYLPHLRCSFDICYNGNWNLSTGCSCSHSPYSTHSDFYQGDYGNYSITHNSDSVIVTCYPANGASSVKAEWPSFLWQGTAPVSGLYSLQPDTYFYASNSSSMSSPYVLSASSVHYSEGASISRTYELQRNYGCSADYIYKLTAYTPKYLVTPDSALDITSGDTYNIDNRVSNYVTNYSYDGDCIEHQIINETNNTYYSPITNETYEMDGWSYDYSTRTYYTTYNTDNSSTVTYGDEYITVTEGSTTNNYYYYITNTGGGSSDDPSGDSSTLIEWLETFKTWLGGKLDGMGGTTVNVTQVIEDNEIEISDSDSEDADGLLDMVKALVEGVVSIIVKSINVVVSGSDSLTTRLTGVGSFIGLFNPSNQSGVFYHPLPSASPSPGVS